MNVANAAAHPYLAQALEDLEGDIVILGGYRGSILREAHEPHRRLWVPIKVGLNIRKVDLEVGLDPEDEERMPGKIISTGMLTHIGPVDMSKRLFKRLRACENSQTGKLRIHDYGYDWRLSPHRLSQELGRFLETLPCNAPGTPLEQRGAIVVAHSLGGLITRHVMNRRPDLFSGVLFAGVPHEGCVNVLGPLRNGDDVLLSSRVLTAQVNFSIRTSFALLPLDGRCFIDKVTKEEYPVDFFDVEQWIKYRWSPCIAPPLPPLQTQNPGRINSIISSMTSVVPDSVMGSLPFTNKRNPQPFRSGQEAKDAIKDHAISAAQTAQSATHAEGGKASGITPQMGGNNPAEHNESTQSSVATHVTIPRDKVLQYLTRTLREVKAFKQELAFSRSHAEQNSYPPMAVIYGKSDPTVYGARVHGRDGIQRADAYDDLAFASGDGVVLAKAAMLPPGFRAVRGGVVASERGHVTLLGDLEAVGRCLTALMAARKAGIGLGNG
jgi:pimeloyl-ACP methyl ester carboxylesterase